jgi:hypothetical protein
LACAAQMHKHADRDEAAATADGVQTMLAASTCQPPGRASQPPAAPAPPACAAACWPAAPGAQPPPGGAAQQPRACWRRRPAAWPGLQRAPPHAAPRLSPHTQRPHTQHSSGWSATPHAAHGACWPSSCTSAVAVACGTQGAAPAQPAPRSPSTSRCSRTARRSAFVSVLMNVTSCTLRASSPALALMRPRCAARSSSLRWCLLALTALLLLLPPLPWLCSHSWQQHTWRGGHGKHVGSHAVQGTCPPRKQVPSHA